MEHSKWSQRGERVEAWMKANTKRNGWTSTAALHDNFEKWSSEHGLEGLTHVEFGRQLRKLGIDARRSNGVLYQLVVTVDGLGEFCGEH